MLPCARLPERLFEKIKKNIGENGNKQSPVKEYDGDE
jgi:hypothetical protein